MCEIAICGRRCKSCRYNDHAAGVLYGSCDYYLITGKLRPCPAGDDCLVFEQGQDKPLYKKKAEKKHVGRVEGYSEFHKLSEETKQRILELYDRGYFDCDISKETGVSVVTLGRFRKHLNLPSQRKRLGYVGARDRSVELHALR